MKNILKYSILTGLFAIPFIPFLVPNTMFFPFITGKGFAFRIIVEIIFGLFVILAVLDREYRPKMSWITKAVLLFTFVTLVADLLGVNVYKSIWSNYERMEGFVLIAHLALYYFVASGVLNTYSLWNKYFNTTIVASVIMSFYGLLQAIGSLTINQGGDRVDATFGNASYFAIYLVFHIFICLYFLFDAGRSKWQKWLYGLVALFEIVILIYTATRGAILGIIGGFIITGILIAWKEKDNPIYRKIAYIVLVSTLVFLGIFFAIRKTEFVQTNFILSRFANISLTEIKTQGRYYVWPMAVKGFTERPLLGWGQENFNFVFNKYYDPRMYAQEQWFDRTHNVFLDWLIAGGILGFLAYFSMYFALMYYIWRRDSSLKLHEKSIFTGMIAAYLFHNLFVFDNLISYILFFSVLGFIHSINSIRKNDNNSVSVQSNSIQYVAVPLVVLATVLVIYFVNVPALLANRTLIKSITPQGDVTKNLELFKKTYEYNSFGSTETTEQLVSITLQVNSAQLPDAIKQSFYDLSVQKIEEKVLETPNDARYLVFAGSFYNRFSQYDKAIKHLENGIRVSPNKPPIYFEIASSYLGKKDYKKAFEMFKKGYDLEPSSPDAKVLYTIGAIYTGNSAVIKEMSTKLDPSVIITDERFLQTYASLGDYSTAINILNERLKADPKNAQTKLSLAGAYATIGQRDRAIGLIREVIAENPSFKDQGEAYINQILSQ